MKLGANWPRIQTRYRLNSPEKELRKKKEGAEMAGIECSQLSLIHLLNQAASIPIQKELI